MVTNNKPVCILKFGSIFLQADMAKKVTFKLEYFLVTADNFKYSSQNKKLGNSNENTHLIWSCLHENYC